MEHGSSPAAWTAVLVCLVGFVLGAVAFVPTPNWTLFTIGAVLVLAALPIGKIMAVAGYGIDTYKKD